VLFRSWILMQKVVAASA